MIRKIYKKYEEISNYLIIGVLTTIVSLTSYYILTFTLLNPNNKIELQVANIISWILSVTFAYFANRIVVFKSKNKKLFLEGIKFYTSRIFTLFLDMFFMYLFVSQLQINDKISKLIVQLFIIVGNYLISKFIVFKDSNL